MVLLQVQWVILWLVSGYGFVFADQTAWKTDSFDTYQAEANKSLLWAPYRSNCYFGIRPRYVNEYPFLMGLMWMDTSNVDAFSKLRHFVDQGDNMQKCAWEINDPRFGGKERIIDPENNLNLTLFFAKSRDGNNWGVRVMGQVLDTTKSSTESLILYMNQNGKPGDSARLDRVTSSINPSKVLQFEGFSPELGDYSVTIEDITGTLYNSQSSAHMSLTVPNEHVWKARDVFQTILRDCIQDFTKETELKPDLLPTAFTIRNIHNFPAGNFHYVQKTFQLNEPFQFDLIFNNRQSKQPIKSSNELSNLITWSLDTIENKFAKSFSFKSEEEKKFARESLSNLLGGIGYFYGTQRVDRTTVLDEEQFEKIELNNAGEEGPLELFSSVPSRAFFPRGFYWDEGFHLLQIMEYDFDLVLEILQSWFNLIDEDGWVARELILGDEARSKVPEEFQVQNPNIANPPTLLLCFSEMLARAQEFSEAQGTDQELGIEQTNDQLLKNSDLLLAYAKNVYPQLLRHFEWFTRTQRGMIEEYLEFLDENVHPQEAFRWVGRTFTHCLPSGLDDYPRALPPDVAELNVDALAWVGVMARSMKQISGIIGLEDDSEEFARIERNIVENLDIIHWSEKDASYCDVTVDDEADDPRKFVCHQGYVTLLPFALKLVDPSSAKITHFVDLIADSDKLLSDYGLLSLSKQDKLFDTGEVYWRGPVWININYLCLDALLHYARSDSFTKPETAEKARNVYHVLRENLISNMYRVWNESGHVYENYNHHSGRGSGTQQFTGWSSLIVNIMGRFPKELDGF
ncbi:LAMI_0D06744g1_1 [Lachancea mirantina]|uniref:Mannosyl-oligosaccharide glucosidase n=1 Tax=Lachancea mirantina TaxID=1230905 RepID=A0A1G4JBX3_9SACH|nr:LAMI_0D06744g1_1 [Lachancea mirantina]